MMQFKDIKPFVQKTGESTVGRYALYGALVSLATTIITGAIKITELILTKKPAAEVLVEPAVGTHVHPDSVFISTRVIVIILMLLCFVGGMELRRHLDKRNKEQSQ